MQRRFFSLTQQLPQNYSKSNILNSSRNLGHIQKRCVLCFEKVLESRVGNLWNVEARSMKKVISLGSSHKSTGNYSQIRDNSLFFEFLAIVSSDVRSSSNPQCFEKFDNLVESCSGSCCAESRRDQSWKLTFNSIDARYSIHIYL